MLSDSDIILSVMREFPILYWPRKTIGGTDYQLARKAINAAAGVMPDVVGADLDLADVIAKYTDATIYYPVFCESSGWWGELLGGTAVVTDKIIVSPECQLMVIRHNEKSRRAGQNHLLAAEIHPASGFFKKMSSSVATVSDMLATDTGTILALFSGANRSKFINIIESTGNSYLGCIGRY